MQRGGVHVHVQVDRGERGSGFVGSCDVPTSSRSRNHGKPGTSHVLPCTSHVNVDVNVNGSRATSEPLPVRVRVRVRVIVSRGEIQQDQGGRHHVPRLHEPRERKRARFTIHERSCERVGGPGGASGAGPIEEDPRPTPGLNPQLSTLNPARLRLRLRHRYRSRYRYRCRCRHRYRFRYRYRCRFRETLNPVATGSAPEPRRGSEPRLRNALRGDPGPSGARGHAPRAARSSPGRSSSRPPPRERAPG